MQQEKFQAYHACNNTEMKVNNYWEFDFGPRVHQQVSTTHDGDYDVRVIVHKPKVIRSTGNHTWSQTLVYNQNKQVLLHFKNV